MMRLGWLLPPPEQEEQEEALSWSYSIRISLPLPVPNQDLPLEVVVFIGDDPARWIGLPHHLSSGVVGETRAAESVCDLNQVIAQGRSYNLVPLPFGSVTTLPDSRRHRSCGWCCGPSGSVTDSRRPARSYS